VVEHLTHQPKAKGLNPATSAGARREKRTTKLFKWHHRNVKFEFSINIIEKGTFEEYTNGPNWF
jgi:hypothetical protein